MSYGDPDLLPRYQNLRVYQNMIRKIELKYLFPEEVDCPHWTFASPVVWAPWMETVWMGNAYDYRAAFFSDVMYSNNKPFKEGALLFKESSKAIAMAMLYQRYPKYSQQHHSVSNMTLFNVFADRAARLGR